MTWTETIAAAAVKGRFTREERLAGCDWEKGPMGERQWKAMPVSGAPDDPIIQLLGFQFMVAMEHNDPEEAAGCLERIEMRVRPKTS